MFNFMMDVMSLNANYALMNGPIGKPEGITPYKVVWSDGKSEMWEHRAGDDPVVIVGPEAGHSTIQLIDWSETQSQIRCALENTSGGVYSVIKLPAKREHNKLDIEYPNTSLASMLMSLPGPFNLVGLCQGGTASLIVSERYPWMIKSLTLVGSPLETSAASSSLDPFLAEMTQADLQALVDSDPDKNMDGKWLVIGFLADKPNTWRQDEVKRWANADNPEFVEADRKFRNWYYTWQHLPGPQYIETVQKFFRDDLADHYTLGNYKGPLRLVAGTKDPIVPLAQMFTMCKYYPQAVTMEIEAGHIGIFMGKKAIANQWVEIFRSM